jgi:hypothetical protein
MRKLAFLSLLCLVCAIPWATMVIIPGIGTMTRVFGMIAAPLALITVIREQRFRKPGIFLLTATLLVVWVILTNFWTVSPEYSLVSTFTYVQMLAFVWLIWEFGRTDKDRQNLMRAYVLGAYIAVLFILYLVFTTSNIGFERFTVTDSEPGEVALMLALAMPMSWYLSLIDPSRVRTWVYRLYVPLGCMAVACTASRQGFISTLIALTFVVWTVSRLRLGFKLSLCLLVPAAAFVAVQVVPPDSFERLWTIADEVDGGTMNGRTLIWRAGIETFADRPLGGLGTGAFVKGVEHELGFEMGAHNTYLSILSSLGLIGFMLFMAVLITAWLSATWLSARSMDSLQWRLWCILFLTLAVGINAISWEHREPTWFVVGLLAAYNVARQQQRLRPAVRHVSPTLGEDLNTRVVHSLRS